MRRAGGSVAVFGVDPTRVTPAAISIFRLSATDPHSNVSIRAKTGRSRMRELVNAASVNRTSAIYPLREKCKFVCFEISMSFRVALGGD